MQEPQRGLEITRKENIQEYFSGQRGETMSLLVLMARLKAILGDRVEAQEIEVIHFCLQHFFLCIDKTYQQLLPRLMNCSARRIEQPRQEREIVSRQAIWSSLSALIYNMKRLEGITSLLQQALLSLLSAIDINQEMEPRTINEEEKLWRHVVTEEEWEQAFCLLTDRLEVWQLIHRRRLSFTIQFAPLLGVIPAIVEMDQSFDQLLQSATSLFGEVLPGFQAIAMGDIGGMATLCWDLLQKIDQSIWQLRSVIPTLGALLQQYAYRRMVP